MEEPVQEKAANRNCSLGNLKPRVEQARKDRDLDPIQKSDQEFWNIRDKAIKEYRPPSAPGMLVQGQPEPHQDISL